MGLGQLREAVVHGVGAGEAARLEADAAEQRVGFNDMLHGRIVTFQILLKDEPGALSKALNVLADDGVNILTINQSIPVNGCAVVTMTAETSALQDSLEEVLAHVSAGTGVIKCEILAG